MREWDAKGCVKKRHRHKFKKQKIRRKIGFKLA